MRLEAVALASLLDAADPTMLRAIAAVLNAIADAKVGLPPQSFPRPAAPLPQPDRTLEIAQAEIISRLSRSTLRRRAKQYGFGWQTASGVWRFSEAALRSYVAGRGADANGAIGADECVPVAQDWDQSASE